MRWNKELSHLNPPLFLACLKYKKHKICMLWEKYTHLEDWEGNKVLFTLWACV